jgi:hypothetical protein
MIKGETEAEMKVFTSLITALVITGCVILLPSMSFSAIDPSPRHHLVEYFHATYDLLRYSLTFIKELEQNHANIDTVLYLVDDTNFPNLYGNKRLIYSGLHAQRSTIINQRDYVLGNWPDLYQRILAYVYKHIHQSTIKPSLKLQSVHLSKSDSDPCKFTGHYLFSWDDDVSVQDLKDFHYNLFLITDEVSLMICNRNITVHNIAYDFIPFTGDDVKQYTGKGFPLMSSSRLIDEKAKTLLLSTEAFPIPEEDSFPYEGKVKSWSLHLFIEQYNSTSYPFSREIFFSKKVGIR